MEKTITRVATLVAAIVFLTFPAIAFIVGFQYVRATLETEAEINGRIATSFVNANPEHWQFQGNRLDELLNRRPGDGVLEIRRIVAVDGSEIAVSADPLGGPVIARRYAIRDSGRAVAYFEVQRSLRSLIAYTALAGLLGLILAIAVAVALRMLPLRALRTTLEQLLAQREHAHGLDLARQAAEVTARLQSQFLANMSHEVRTPMNGVLGMTELLLETELDDRQRRFADAIQRSGEVLLKIVNDILDFSKIESGKLELEHIDFNLRELVEDIAELVAQRAQSKGIEVICKLPPTLAPVFLGDPGRLRQVLANLVNNGIKFTERGHVLIRLDCVEDVSPASCRVAFSVTDTGIGIAPEAAARLFQPFVQADVSTTRKYGGSGLGLAISQQLVGLMGGLIELRSAVGEGSTFSFDLMLQKSPLKTEMPASENLAGLRALVVEDHPVNRRILQEHVIAWGMKSGCAADGREGLDLLEAAAARGEPYDVALIDLMMPRMDGMELTRRIRKDPALAGLAVVMLTSIALQGEIAAARGAGVSAYVTKPIRQAELFRTITAVVGRRAGPGQEFRVAAQPVGRIEAHVLLAEDNLVNQELAVAMLAGIGCTVEVVSNGRDAIQALAARACDAVLMDCQMPEMDGFEATAAIRAGAAGVARSTVPIIALTANAQPGDRERCLAAGMDDYASKPVSKRDLTTVLLRFTGGGAGGGAATASTMPKVAVAGGARATRVVEALNKRALDSIRELDPAPGTGLLAQIGTLYLETAPGLAESLRQAAASGDVAAVGRAAHSLKSSSADLGADALAYLCKRVEDRARSGEISGDDVQGIDQELELSLLMVRSELCGEGLPA